MAETATATINKPAWVDLATHRSGGRSGLLREGLRLGDRGQPRSAVRRLRAGQGRRQGCRRDRWHAVARPADRLVDLHRHRRRRRSRRQVSRRPAAPSSPRPSTSATRAGWRSSRTRPARSSRPGRRPGWAASRPRARTRSAGPSSTPAGSTRSLPFYQQVFGWTPKTTGTPERPYTEFQVDGQSIAGATEMNPMVPAEVPSYWMVYFSVDDVDAPHRTALDAGAREIVAADGLPGRPVVDRQRPAGRRVRPPSVTG